MLLFQHNDLKNGYITSNLVTEDLLKLSITVIPPEDKNETSHTKTFRNGGSRIMFFGGNNFEIIHVVHANVLQFT